MVDDVTTYTPLANQQDVKALLGRDLTDPEMARVDGILAKASELFRRRSGRVFTPGRYQVRLKVDGGEVRLPEKPISTVHSVTDRHGTPVSYRLRGAILDVPQLRSSDFVDVDYEGGSTTVPDVVRLCIADIGRKVLEIDPKAVAGLVQSGTTRGPFSDQATYATWAQGGQTMLAPDDAALADSFRPSPGGTITLRP